MKIPDKVYNVLKWITLICIPACITCATAIMTVLNVDPQTITVVVGIATAVNTLLGTLLGISTYNYNKTTNTEEEVIASEEDIH